MQPTMELAELDELVEQLDASVTQIEVADNEQTPSLLLCSLGCGGGHSWYWYC